MAQSDPDNRIARLIRAVISAAVLLVVVLIAPYTPRPTEEIKWLVVSWAGLVAGVLWLSSAFLTGAPMRWPRLFGPVIAAMLAFLLAASLLSPHTGLNLHETRKFLFLALAFGAAAHAYRTSAQVRALMFTMCFAVALSSIYAFFQRAGIDPFPWEPSQMDSDEYRNLPGSFGNPNYAAHAMVLTIILSGYLAFNAGWRWCAVFLPIFCIHLFLTQQRGGLIALAIAVLLMLLVRVSGRVTQMPARRSVAAMMGTAAVTVAAAAGVMGYLSVTTGAPVPLDQSALVRYQGYASATKMIIDRPVLGYGPASYPVENPPYWTPFEQQLFAREFRFNEHVHNDPLELAVDAGIPAASLYLILLTLAIAHGLYWSFTRPQRGEAALGLALAAAFTAFLVDGLFGFNLRVPVTALFLFLLLGALEGVWRQAQTSAEPPGEDPNPAPPWLKPVSAVLVGAAVFGAVLDTRYFLGMRDLQSGRAWAAGGSHERAQGYFARAQTRAPWHWRIAREQARVSRLQGDLELATLHAGRAVSLHPHSVFMLSEAAEIKFAHAARVQEAAMRDALEEPVALAERAVELCPYYAPAHESLGRMYSTLASEIEQAEPESDDALALWQQAAAHIEQALNLGAPNREELYQSLALARAGQRDEEGLHEALAHALAAAQGTPNWDVHQYFAAHTGQYDALANALRNHIERLQRLPVEGETAARLAEAHMHLGRIQLDGFEDPDAARQSLQQAVMAAPGDGGTWRVYAEFIAYHGNTAVLRDFILEVWEQREALPGSGLPPHITALALAWEGGAESFARGAAVFSRFLVERPGEQVSAHIRQEMSWAADILIAEVQGLPAGGEATARARLHTGIVQTRLGRYQAGLGLLRAALPGLPVPMRIDCRVHMAHALIQLERLDEAARELERVVEQEPTLFELWVLLARTQRDAGRTFEARRTYDAILRDFDLDHGTRTALEEELRALGR